MVLESSMKKMTNEDNLVIINEQLAELIQKSSGKLTNGRTFEEIAEEILKDGYKDDTQIVVDIDGLPPIPNSALITIAGRAVAGPNYFAVHLMNRIIDALPEEQALYFNLEMDQGFLNAIMSKKASVISNSRLTIEEIETYSRLAYLKEPISIIVVNHIDLIQIKNKNENKEQEQTEIAQRLTALALNLNCVIIVLVQINNDFKDRPVGDRCPILDDAIDSIGTTYSSGWWLGIDQPQIDTGDMDYKDLFQIKCRKTRFEEGLFSLDLNFRNGQFFKRSQQHL
ncbi:TPA: DnaB-like helicase C-terminal domain-containing protein [Legionella bozemanae]